MGLAWNWLALPGFLSAACSLALLALLLRARGTRPTLLLSLLLAAQAVMGLAGFGAAYLTDDHDVVYGLVLLTMGMQLLALASSTLLLGELPLPRLRALRSRAAIATGLTLALASAVAAFAFPRAYAAQLAPTSYAPWIVIPGPAMLVAAAVGMIVSALALVVATLAFRRAPRGTPARERAAGFLVAFGFRNGLNVVLIVLVFGLPNAGERAEIASIVAGGLGSAAFVLLLAYAILRTHLFDLDLRLKRGVRRTSLAGAFVAVFFIVSELASALLSERIGTVAGVLAAGALVFALAPLQRAAERVADAAMPHVAATPAYIAYRKMHVYRAALEAALENDGELSPRERKLLHRLRRELDLAEADAAALEAEVRQASAGA